MAAADDIPFFTLYGETARFPDVVHCERIVDRASVHGWQISPHRHAHLAQLFVVTAGHAAGRIDGAEATLAAGEMLYIPPQKVHSFTFRPQTEGLVISLPASVVKTVGPTSENLATILSQPHCGPLPAQIAALCDTLAATLAGNSIFRAQAAVGLAHAILATLAESAASAAPTATVAADKRLAALDRLISRNMAEGWRAADYASALAVSTGHLSRMCRKASGLGTTAYIEHHITEEACRMLAFTRLPVSEIGYRLGYDDPSYFSKRFRAARGLTPSDYRAQFTT